MRVKIIDGKKPAGFTSLTFMGDLKKYGIMLHTICNLTTDWWGVEFVRKSDNKRKCVIFYDEKLTKKEQKKVIESFIEVEKYFGVKPEDSRYFGVIK